MSNDRLHQNFRMAEQHLLQQVTGVSNAAAMSFSSLLATVDPGRFYLDDTILTDYVTFCGASLNDNRKTSR